MDCTAYSKPAMNFVCLRNEEAIAADGNCLSAAAGTDGGIFYYDITGNGWIVVKTAGNCSGNITNMYYEPKDASLQLPPQDIIDQAMAEAQASMDSNKQLFAGSLPWEPAPEWS